MKLFFRLCKFLIKIESDIRIVFGKYLRELVATSKKGKSIIIFEFKENSLGIRFRAKGVIFEILDD